MSLDAQDKEKFKREEMNAKILEDIKNELIGGGQWFEIGEEDIQPHGEV